MRKNVFWGVLGLIILWYLIRIIATWFGFALHHPIIPIIQLFTAFMWVTKYVLPWIVLYWLIRFVQSFERKNSQD